MKSRYSSNTRIEQLEEKQEYYISVGKVGILREKSCPDGIQTRGILGSLRMSDTVLRYSGN